MFHVSRLFLNQIWKFEQNLAKNKNWSDFIVILKN